MGVSITDLGTEAFRWTAETGMLGLGVLSGTAHDVTADGTLIVGRMSGSTEPFIWDASNGARNLQDVLARDFGLDLTGWVLRRVSAISDDGTVIVGEGVNPSGNSEAWMAIVPEPSTGGLAALGLLSLLRQVRRRLSNRTRSIFRLLTLLRKVSDREAAMPRRLRPSIHHRQASFYGKSMRSPQTECL